MNTELVQLVFAVLTACLLSSILGAFIGIDIMLRLRRPVPNAVYCTVCGVPKGRLGKIVQSKAERGWTVIGMTSDPTKVGTFDVMFRNGY